MSTTVTLRMHYPDLAGVYDILLNNNVEVTGMSGSAAVKRLVGIIIAMGKEQSIVQIRSKAMAIQYIEEVQSELIDTGMSNLLRNVVTGVPPIAEHKEPVVRTAEEERRFIEEKLSPIIADVEKQTEDNLLKNVSMSDRDVDRQTVVRPVPPWENAKMLEEDELAKIITESTWLQEMCSGPDGVFYIVAARICLAEDRHCEEEVITAKVQEFIEYDQSVS